MSPTIVCCYCGSWKELVECHKQNYTVPELVCCGDNKVSYKLYHWDGIGGKNWMEKEAKK